MTQRGIFLLVIAILLALSSTWILSKWRQQTAFSEALNQTEINVYMSEFQGYSTNAQGSPNYTLKAEHSTNQYRNNITQIFRPQYSMITKTGNINIYAKKATKNQQDEIELTNNVIIKKKASQEKPGYRVDTEYLRYTPNNQQIDTDLPIKIITTNNIIIKSIGLNEDLSSQITRLKSNVHTNYAPPTY